MVLGGGENVILNLLKEILFETKPSLQPFIGALSELEMVISHIVGFGVGNQTQVLVHAKHLPYL